MIKSIKWYRRALTIVLFLATVALWWNRARIEEERKQRLQQYIVWPPGAPVDADAPPASFKEASRIHQEVKRLTYEDCLIRNTELHGTIETNTPVIVVRVHKDFERLQYLIISLAEVANINTVLLIFSHSYFDHGVNELIRKIDFCKVAQIFFPFSVQANLNVFPGIDVNDCLSPEMREKMQSGAMEECSSRDARRTESKHHWWWTARHVFESFEWSAAHRGMVMFLDEASYVAPDLLHMLGYARKGFKYFPSAMIVALGRVTVVEDKRYDLLTLESWDTSYDVALAFNHTAWQRISYLGVKFCMYNDCSWSYSLLNLFSRVPAGYAEAILTVMPRALPTGRYRSGEEGARVLSQLFSEARQKGLLFPKRVRTVFLWNRAGRVAHPARVSNGTGGWFDVRDQLFCIDPQTIYGGNDLEELGDFSMETANITFEYTRADVPRSDDICKNSIV